MTARLFLLLTTILRHMGQAISLLDLVSSGVTTGGRVGLQTIYMREPAATQRCSSLPTQFEEECGFECHKKGMHSLLAKALTIPFAPTFFTSLYTLMVLEFAKHGIFFVLRCYVEISVIKKSLNVIRII